MFSIGKEATADTGRLFLDRSSVESVRLPDLQTRVNAGKDVKGIEETCWKRRKWIWELNGASPMVK